MPVDPFVAHRGLLFTVAYEMLGSAADAEDVVQETWLRWDAIGEVARAEVGDPRAFLVRILTRKSLDRLRSNARRREGAPLRARSPGHREAQISLARCRRDRGANGERLPADARRTGLRRRARAGRRALRR